MEKMQVNATEITDPILATAHIFLRKEEFLGLFFFFVWNKRYTGMTRSHHDELLEIKLYIL